MSFQYDHSANFGERKSQGKSRTLAQVLKDELEKTTTPKVKTVTLQFVGTLTGIIKQVDLYDVVAITEECDALRADTKRTTINRCKDLGYGVVVKEKPTEVQPST